MEESKKDNGILVLTVKPKMSNEEIANLEGTYFNESDFDLIIKENADVFRIDERGNKHLLLKIRKNIIPKSICKTTFLALIDEAKKPHTNRGAAAGLLTMRKLPPYVKEIVQKGRFRGKYIGKDDRIRKDDISNLSRSSIIGYYDQIDRNYFRKKSLKNNSVSRNDNLKTLKNNKNILPCRMTKFTKEQTDKWKSTFAFFKTIDKIFEKLTPEAHKKQKERASMTPDYQILDTAFSTATINYNWQTALHRDAGDFKDGFGNLVILEDPRTTRMKWKGGFLGFPQYKIAVDVRNGDYLAMDVHQWHANTEIIPFNDSYNNLKTRIQLEHARLSIVSYLRKNMIKCKHTLFF
jgi:hypothetical protein